MKAVVQRVSGASVTVDGEIKGKIGKGFLVFLGVGKKDSELNAERLANKIIKMRIFSDENRPNFINAGNPETAEKLYEYFIGICGKYIPVVEKGVFGADMKVELENDGPFTVVLEDI